MFLLAVDHFSKEKTIVILNLHQRGGWQSLIQPELGSAFTNVSDDTVKNLTGRSSYSDDGRVADLAALGLPLIRSPINPLIERNGLIDEQSVRHNPMFPIP